LDESVSLKLENQLSFIDELLAERNAQEVLKSAVEICKPFFFKLMEDRLRSESDALLNGLRY
jgi:hypothetical protein